MQFSKKLINTTIIIALTCNCIFANNEDWKVTFEQLMVYARSIKNNEEALEFITKLENPDNRIPLYVFLSKLSDENRIIQILFIIENIDVIKLSPNPISYILYSSVLSNLEKLEFVKKHMNLFYGTNNDQSGYTGSIFISLYEKNPKLLYFINSNCTLDFNKIELGSLDYVEWGWPQNMLSYYSRKQNKDPSQKYIEMIKLLKNGGIALFRSFELETVCLADRVRVRELPNLKSDVLGFISKGEKVKITGSTLEYFDLNDHGSYPWARIEYNGKVGYVYGEYIKVYIR